MRLFDCLVDMDEKELRKTVNFHVHCYMRILTGENLLEGGILNWSFLITV